MIVSDFLFKLIRKLDRLKLFAIRKKNIRLDVAKKNNCEDL